MGTTNMKLFVFACLVAMALDDAEPKADADPYYGYYGLGYHGLGYGLGYGYGHGLGYAGYYGHGLGHYGYYGKRSADAEPTAVAEAKADADPYYGYYGHGYGLGYARYGYGLGHHSGYAGLGHYGYGLGYYGKRSAEAEPTADADAKADPYYGYYGHGSSRLKSAKNQLRNYIKFK